MPSKQTPNANGITNDLHANRTAASPSEKKNVRGGWSLNHLKLRKDYRADMPLMISRFTGYRPPGAVAPYEPIVIPPFTWLTKIPLRYEVWIFGWIGAFCGMLLIEGIMSTNTAFRDVYRAPTIITSFGASAVLLFGVVESPIAQPRNFIFGHFISALVGTCITRLFVLNRSYQGYLDNTQFHPSTFINGGLSMSTALLAMFITGTVHPPAGATALNAAVQTEVVSLSWRYLPVILSSSLLMLGWALIINNLGRRRYPFYWWAPGPTFVRDPNEEDNADVAAMEEGEAKREEFEEGALRRESIPETDDETINGESSEGDVPDPGHQSSAAVEPASLESAVDSYPGEFHEFQDQRRSRKSR